MSFGAQPGPTDHAWKKVNDAIHDAVGLRKGRILFFAAAGNDGHAQGDIMFPAQNHHVIPVFGTDVTGAYLETLNPAIEPDGPAIFGTLAHEVPCAGLEAVGEQIKTGTSYSTAIAAGLAASLLETHQ
ncbi:Hypothetical protein D9617_4g003950 [Elsinoe fawcettii]|nr:Hypothetical protein D9617_4g003950 [Elsinoe fawcettii]